MPVETKYLPHYTHRDYAQWEGRWELIQGIPHAMSPQPSIRHQQVSGRIHALLQEALAGCAPCQPLLPVDWRVSDDTVLQPDNLVVCGEVEGAYLTEAPVLIFEVLSPSTAYKDRHVKYALYAEAGVGHCVLVEPEACAAEVFALEAGAYVKRGTCGRGGDVRAGAVCDFAGRGPAVVVRQTAPSNRGVFRSRTGTA